MSGPTDREGRSLGLDRAGALCSTVCAVHCVSIAFFPSVLIALGLNIVAEPVVEWGFTLAAVALAGVAFVAGFRRHRTASVAVVFALGIAGLAGSRVLEAIDAHGPGTLLSVCAAFALVSAHVLNIRFTKRSDGKHT